MWVDYGVWLLLSLWKNNDSSKKKLIDTSSQTYPAKLGKTG